MKLLIITQKVDRNDPILGFFHRWIEEFAKHFEKITVICLEKGEYSLPENVSVYSLGKEEGKGRFVYVVRFYHLIWKLRKEYEAVFVHMNPIYLVLFGAFWKIWRKKIGLWYTHKHVDLKLRIAVCFCDFVMTASKESFRLPTPKLRVMGHGIDTSFFSPGHEKKQDKISLVTIGRISPVKDYETLISAVAQLKDLPIQLEIVGGITSEKESDYLEYLKQEVVRQGCDNTVVFVGPVPHDKTKDYLEKADIFVNMSHTGSLDKAGLEAMASALPVVTCNEAIVPFLGKYQDKLFFRKKDSEGLARIIEGLVHMDSSERSAMGGTLRDVVIKEHNLPQLIRGIVGLYYNVV